MKIWKYLMSGIVACAFAACSDDENEGNDTPAADGKLMLVSSTACILNDGTDNTQFTVLLNDEDVTADAKIYQKGAKRPMDGYSFATTTEGHYTFFASYKTLMSGEVSVDAVTNMVETPADPQASKFEGFARKVLAVQGTSLGCIYCPYVIACLQEFVKLKDDGEAQFKNADKAVIVAAHSVISDDMVNDYSNQLIRTLGVNGIPSVNYNFSASDGLDWKGSPKLDAKTLDTDVASIISQTAHTNIAAATEYDAEKNTITVTADVKIEATTGYRISAWLVEDGVQRPGEQKNATPVSDKEYNLDVHNNVLRYMSHMSESVYGTKLGGMESVSKGSVCRFSHVVDLNRLTFDNAENLRVVLVVNKRINASKFSTDNVVSCPLNSSVPFTYND